MKRISKLTMFAFAGALALTGCKKGADDPFISLKSRDSRLAGTWTLSSVSGTSVNTYRDLYNTATSSQPSSSTSTTSMSYSNGVGGSATTTTQSYTQMAQTGTGTVTVNQTITESQTSTKSVSLNFTKTGDVTQTTITSTPLLTHTITQTTNPAIVAPTTGSTNGPDGQGGLLYDGNYSYNFVGANTKVDTTVISGTWAYGGDKKEVLIITLNDGAVNTYDILGLASKDLKLHMVSTNKDGYLATNYYGTGTSITSTTDKQGTSTIVDITIEYKK